MTLYHNPEVNRQRLNNQIGTECTTVTSEPCGSGTVKLFRTANDLYGIQIAGNQIDEQRFRVLMEEWKDRYGGVIETFDGPDQYQFIIQKYFRSIHESRAERERIAYNALQPSSGQPTPPLSASIHPLLGQFQESIRKERASESKERAEKAKQTHLAETTAIDADTDAKLNACNNLGSGTANQNVADINELHSQISCQEISESCEKQIRRCLNNEGIDYQGPFTPLGSLKITTLEEFDKWFPEIRKGSYDGFITILHDGWIKVHKKTGVVLKAFSLHDEDYNIILQISDKLEYDALCASNVVISRQNILKEAAERHLESNKKLEDAEKQLKKDLEQYRKIKKTRQEHVQINEALYHIEVLTKNLGNRNANQLATGGKHVNDLCMNLRFIATSLNEIDDFKNASRVSDAIKAITLSGSMAMLSGLLGAVAAYSQIVAMMKQHHPKQALLADDFYNVVNNHLTPLFMEIKESISDLAEKSKQQTHSLQSDILRSLSDCHKSLLQSIETQTALIKKQSDNNACNNITEKSDQMVDGYYRQSREVSEYIEGSRHSSAGGWFWTYCEDTIEAIKLSGGLIRNGNNGRQFTFNVENAAENPIYCSPIIYNHVFNRNDFTCNLGMLYSAGHTFILLVKRMLEKEAYDGRQDDDIIRRNKSLEVAREIVKGVDQHIDLFGQMDVQLDSLIASYEQFVTSVKANKDRTAALKQNKSDAAKAWAANNRERILNGLEGREMFYLDKFIHEPIRTKTYEKELHDTIWNREGLRAFARTFVNATNCRVEAYQKTKEASLKSLIGMKKVDGMAEHSLDTNNWTRRIWSQDGKQFGTSLTVQTHPIFIPLAVNFNYFDNVMVGSDDASKIRNPLLDCKVTYIGSNNGLQVEFDENSRLQKSDVESIKPCGESAANRRQMFEEILSLFSDNPANDHIRPLKNKTEVCMPLKAELPPILLPKSFMSYMQKFLCPESDNLTLLGCNFDLKYDFAKAGDKYQLKIYAELEGNPYISCVVSEFDTATVDAFKNREEFLYCIVFALYENDGIPGNLTLYKPNKELLAPVMESFPGLISILERNPNRCFSFNHKNYNAHIATKDANLLSNQLQLFRKGEVLIEKDRFLMAQSFIMGKKNDVRNTDQFKNFKTRYDTFVALAALACNKKASEIQALLAVKAGIEHPDVSNVLEMAAYFESPTDENKQEIKRTLGDLESPARRAMNDYKEKLDKIITFLTRVKDAPHNRVPKNEHTGLALELGLGLGENPKSRVNLMDDTYRPVALANDNH